MLIDLFVRGLIAHLVGDFILQNENMVKNKISLLHYASWLHSGIHFAVMLIFGLPFFLSLVISIFHLLVDTRKPLNFWRNFYRQTNNPDHPAFISFTMWQDQALHIIILYICIILFL